MQVSIAGFNDMVEEARTRLRSIAPIAVTIQLRGMISREVNLEALMRDPSLETVRSCFALHLSFASCRHSATRRWV